MPLYGQELGPTVTPLEAGLGWAVSPQQGAIYRARCAAQGTPGRRAAHAGGL